MSRKVGRTARDTDELWRELLRLRFTGLSVGKIAGRLRVSNTLVTRVTNEIRNDDEQQAAETGEVIPAGTYWPVKRRAAQ